MILDQTEKVENLVMLYQDKLFEFEQFLPSVLKFFEKHPDLQRTHPPIVHSIKHRLKDPEHLRDKINRKLSQGREITEKNFFDEITDFIGVRVLHLYPDQFRAIHEAITAKVDQGDWLFVENPIAYTWDPESVKSFEEMEIKPTLRDTFYTSIHYLIRPNNPNGVVKCEIQVRTLFEEIWGEIDHTINYPNETSSIACKEQLRVLSKLVSTGTRLADSIFRSHIEYDTNKAPKS